MKRKLIMLILAIAGIVGVYAQDDAEQAFINGFISGMDKELVSLDDGDMRYNGTFVEGKNIICSVTINEAEFGGLSVKQAFMMVGVDEAKFGEMMREEMFAHEVDEAERLGLQMLKSYGYKIYFRIIGNPSNVTMNCPTDYEVLLK